MIYRYLHQASETEVFADIEILPNVTALQEARLNLAPNLRSTPCHSTSHPYGEYPPKIPESEIKPTGETGEIVPKPGSNSRVCYCPMMTSSKQCHRSLCKISGLY